jgi:hypothetical protein
MASTSSRVEMDKFNGSNFELWKLKMEDMLVDRDLWDAVSSSTKPQTTSQEDWDKVDRKAKGLIRLCLADSYF